MLVPLLILTACENESSGATYPAAALYRVDGVGLVDGEYDPRSGELLVDGSPEQGHEWPLVIEGGNLWVGVPERGEVWRWTSGSGSPTTVATGQPSEAFGAALAVANEEPIVGAPAAGGGDDAAGAGAVLLGLGDVRRVVGSRPQLGLGSVVAACGDLDGDGQADAAMSAPLTGALAGAVYTVPVSSPSVVSADLTPVGSPAARSAFGAALACSADLLGDSAPDLLVGARYAVGAGGADGEGAVTVWDAAARAAGAPAATLFAHEADDDDAGEPGAFGSALVTCQLRPTGRPAIVVGAPTAREGAGVVSIFFPGEELATGNLPTILLVGEADEGRFGAALDCADRDGDGSDELFVGAPGENAPDGTPEAGALYAFTGLGASSGAFGASAAGLRFFADRGYLRTGERFAVGDLDGDALAEVVLLVRQR